MNKVILIGRLTADPELRQTASGVATCRFTVAVNRKYKNDNGEFDADFISCVAWRQTAEFVTRYFLKGKMICVEGGLRNNNYQDRTHPDVTHYNTELLVENVEFCGDRSGSNAGGGQPSTTTTANYQQAAPTPTQQQPQQQQEQQMSYGSLSDFEEILSDGDVPF